MAKPSYFIKNSFIKRLPREPFLLSDNYTLLAIKLPSQNGRYWFMRFLAIFTILFSLNTVYAADSCSTVEIDTTHMPKNNNQNEHNWCVFWSSADLFSYYEKEPLSSYDMALQYFNNEIVRDEEINDYTDIGANMSAALIIAQQGKGLCVEAQTNFTNGDWAELSVFFKKISSTDKKLAQIICQSNLQNSLPLKGVPSNILKILDKLSGDKRSAALLDVTCGKRYQLGKYGVGSRTIENFPPEKIMEKLDTLLNQNNPASVSYDWDFIKNPKDYTKKESNHSSTIIGRRFNPVTLECEYKIKDSAGNRCPKKTPYACNKADGTIWVPKLNLLNNIYEVNWLVKAK